MNNDTSGLDDRVAHLARIPRLLIACDYDGTIAPIVDDPMQATPRRDTVIAMRSLADLPQTNVAVISGRALRDLAALSRLPEEIRLVGSHGSEFEVGLGAELDADAVALRDTITRVLRELADRTPGAFIEKKPTGVAVHYRNVDVDDVAAMLAELESVEVLRDATMSGQAEEGSRLHQKHGAFVVEYSVVELDKGRALDEIRRQVSASAVLFIGDDATDEDAFGTLAGPDVGVKVGEAETLAEFSVANTDDVANLLARLAELRRSWLMGSAAVPIEAHSMLSDQRTAAMVAPDARITWMCLPRIDSAAVFAELVGGPAAGFFSVRPAAGGRPTSQRYSGSTMMLESIWPTMHLTDYLDCSGGRTTELAGRTDLIRVITGTGEAVIEFAPRLDFGRVPTRIEVIEDGLCIVGTHDLMALRSPGVEWQITDDGTHQTALATVGLQYGDITLELRSGTSDIALDVSEASRREGTTDFWQKWADALVMPPLASDLVRRSALVLKGLVHGPTGAVVAAATTSLPECLGGVRNWDYRYCWIRDAALSVTALSRLGSTAEGLAYLDWVADVVDRRGDLKRIAPLFNVVGHHLPPEAEIADLPGYAGSRPVRVGNAAEGQVQLDVFGPVVDLAYQLHNCGAVLDDRHWQLVAGMAEAVVERWRDPDHGIWEIRKPPRHHTHTKVMCWVTLDRAIRLGDHIEDADCDGWAEARDMIAEEVLDKAYKPELRAFGAAYDGSDMDASVLAIGLSGLIQPSDARFVGTVAAVEALLRDGPTVYRYRSDDGLPGHEGGWHFMSSWLIDAFELVGRTKDAHELFEQMCGLAGPTGLLSEEYDPATGQALGNHPQAYSHLGLINNAINLS